MKHHSILSVETFTLEGTLFAPDLLDRLFKGELDRDYPFGVPAGMSAADEYGRAFRIAVAAWKQYRLRREKNPQAAERKFLVSLFHDALGYDLSEKPEDFVPFRLAGEGTVPIFYSWYEDGFDETASRFSGDGLSRRKRSVTQYVQEWLNAKDDHLWAIVTNARLIRLLRDNNSLTRPSYVEFDLERILSEERYPDFVFLWRLLYHDRVGAAPSGNDSVWEKMRQRGESEGVRVFNDLRDGVIRALQILGNAFLKNTRNEKLRGAFDSGMITDQAYFQELLLVAYRFLFLYAAEERKSLLFPAPDSPSDAGETYEAGYSLHRLIRRAFRASAYDRHIDLYESVKIVFAALDHGEKELALPALGGLFRKDRLNWLNGCVLDNRALLEVTRALRWTQMNGAYQLVDYRNLGAEELGSVYESLLELVPTVSRQERTFGFVGITEEGLTAGNARKTSGSYYTPSCLVDEQVTRVVDPLVRQRLAAAGGPQSSAADKEKAILSMSVLDVACGSGHFLLAAARRLAERLAEIRAGDEAVSSALYREALRDVVSNCIYGVDLNPMALELAKIALWIETLVPGQPLGFLDSHFVCGNSVLGIARLKQLDGGIQAEAFEVVGNGDAAVAKALKAENAAALRDLKKNPHAVSLFTQPDNSLAEKRAAIEAMPTSTIAEIEAKTAAWESFYAEARSNRLAQAADLYTAAFLMEKKRLGQGSVAPETPSVVPTTANLRALLGGEALNAPSSAMLDAASATCREANVLHWPLMFPTVFGRGGFDVILTNPPWDRIKVQAKEFFATRYPDISEAQNASKRNKLIAQLEHGSIAEQKLFADFNAAVAMSERTSAFVHAEGGHYPLTGIGDVNLYALFSELVLQILAPDGRAGLVVPTGICTDNSTKDFFAAVTSEKRLEYIYDFENRQKLFPAVDSRYKFALLSIGNSEHPDLAFFMTHPRQLAEAERHFTLTAEEFALVNPNTRTAPVCRTGYDAELMKKIYSRTGVLVKEGDAETPDENPWEIEYQRMFDMSNDSKLFRDTPSDDLFPLYEAKMMHIYDHRWATFLEGKSDIVDCTVEEKRSPAFEPRPQYWVSKRATYARLADVPPALFKAAKKWDVEAMRVALANWAIRTIHCETIGDEKNVREIFGDGFLESLPANWQAKKFDTTCRRPLERIELDGIYDDDWFESFLAERSPKWLIGWRDITNATNARTDINFVFPAAGANHKILLFSTSQTTQLTACLLADLNSMPHDWASRQKIGGLDLTYTYKNQLPTLAPSAYTEEDIAFVVPRVLELTYTSYSLKPWAEALGHDGEPFVYDEARRGVLKAELDVFFAKKYGLTEEEFRYILDPKDVKGENFPSESFRTLRDDEISRFGEYRTRRLALEAWRAAWAQGVENTYVRQETFTDRSLYLRFLVGQLLAQTPMHRMSIGNLFGAFASLRNPMDIAAIKDMPDVVSEWARQYRDGVRSDECIESVLEEMFEAEEISISKEGVVSLRDNALLLVANDLPDVAMDARMALAFMRLVQSEERLSEWMSCINASFRKKITEGFYARAA